MKKQHNRTITIGSLVILVVIAITWHFWQQRGHHQRPEKAEANAVEVAAVTQMNIPISVNAVGVLQAVQSINISPQSPGVLTGINYQPGTLVQAGTPLFQFDNRIFVASLNSANADFKVAQMTYNRSTQLAKQGALSKAELDQNQANYSKAKAQVDMSQTLLDQTTLKAPFTGYVGPKNVSVGDYVKVGQVLTTLTDRSQLLVNYSLPEKYLSKVKMGDSVSVKITENGDKLYQGKVMYISPTIDVSTHSVAMQAQIPNPNNDLTPGSFVRVTQNLGMINNAVVVPRQSLVATISGSKIFIVKNNKAVQMDVDTGESNADFIEIKNAKIVGDQVVIAGQQQLQNGSPVKIVKGS